MSISNFNAKVWAGEILVNLRKTHVAGMAVNRNYEGDITAYGDQVQISNIAAVTAKDYSANTDMDAPETLTGDDRLLTIDQAKYINFQVDDVDRAQQRPKVMSEAMQEAAHALSDASDSFLLGQYADAGNTLGDGTTPITLDTANVYENVLEAATLLDEANVPRGNRWMIVPPWIHSTLVKSDEFLRATNVGDQTVMNGMVGQIGGFNVLMSNNIDSTDDIYKPLFGYNGAITFAEQILDMEAYRPESRFADAVKGLYLYGGKVVRPSGLVAGYFSRPS